MTTEEADYLVEQYGNVIYESVDNIKIVDRQQPKCDLVFVWNKDNTLIDEVRVINIQDTFMIDINKKYRVEFIEIEEQK